jgi:hypothetical protein
MYECGNGRGNISNAMCTRSSSVFVQDEVKHRSVLGVSAISRRTATTAAAVVALACPGVAEIIVEGKPRNLGKFGDLCGPQGYVARQP